VIFLSFANRKLISNVCFTIYKKGHNIDATWLHGFFFVLHILHNLLIELLCMMASIMLLLNCYMPKL
jgi:hypothetical protein